jgi:SAM-dependent methyltransferase
MYSGRLARELPAFDLPHETPPPGEEDVLRSFSNEWVSYDWNPNAYWNLTHEDMYQSMRFLLDLDSRPLKQKIVLEAGIGIGGIADYVSRSEECEMIGVDLSYAVDAAHKHFGHNPLLHIIQASVFAMPFLENSFDMVYSQGVIMHTYSTKTAFARLARLPRVGGRLYIWVYSYYDEKRTFERRMLMKMEKLLRPVISRLPESLQTATLLPITPLYLIHQNLLAGRRGATVIKYGWREAIHAARDRFTPRFAHRHTEEEVCGWFREAGYTKLQCVSKREHPEFIPISLIAATAVDGTRSYI